MRWRSEYEPNPLHSRLQVLSLREPRALGYKLKKKVSLTLPITFSWHSPSEGVMKMKVKEGNRGGGRERFLYQAESIWKAWVVKVSFFLVWWDATDRILCFPFISLSSPSFSLNFILFYYWESVSLLFFYQFETDRRLMWTRFLSSLPHLAFTFKKTGLEEDVKGGIVFERHPTKVNSVTCSLSPSLSLGRNFSYLELSGTTDTVQSDSNNKFSIDYIFPSFLPLQLVSFSVIMKELFQSPVSFL